MTHRGNAENRITRRLFTKKLTLGAAAVRVSGLFPGGVSAGALPRKRRIVVMSDIHVGRVADDQDGAVWLGHSMDDIRRHVDAVDYGLTLGDITHEGDRASLERYLALRDRSNVPRWFQLAGNHEYRNGGIRHYLELIGDTRPYLFVDGNIVWIFLSDERKRVSGNLTYHSYLWIKENLDKHRDKIIVFCSHQLPPNTLRRSDEAIFCIHPTKWITELLTEYPITLYLCGHEHHQPYSGENILIRDGTTYINVASVNHAYGTGASGSLILEFEEGAHHIIARRRNHDAQSFEKARRISIPTAKSIALDR